MEYIPIFAASFLIILSLIILIDLISIFIKKEKGPFIKAIYIFGIIICSALGITALILNYSNNQDNQAIIRMALIILIGVILIVVGSFLIFYYSATPKYKVTSKEYVTEDGKKITISESKVNVRIKKEKKRKSKVENKEIKSDSASISLIPENESNKQN